MVIAPPTPDERQRITQLHALALLDSAPEPAFDALTRLVARLLRVPVALVSLVDEHRQWFKSRVGLDATETPRDLAFCAHAIHGDGPLVVPDALLDPRFADNPLVTGAPHIRAYAGIPLRTAEGHALGTLCAIDHQPRAFSAADLALLQEFADVLHSEVRHREAALRGRQAAECERARHEAELHAMLQHAQDAFISLEHDISQRKSAERRLADSERRLNAVVNDQTDIVCRFDHQGALTFANAACRRLFSLTDASIGVATWRAVVWPADAPAVKNQLKAMSPDNPLVVTENRFVNDAGVLRWAEFINRGFFDAAGVLQEVQTVGRDVTERKNLEACLADATERQRDLYDNAPCGYHSIDANGKFLQINRTALAWLGCERDEVVGRLGPTDFFTEEGRAQFNLNFPKFIAEGRIGPLQFDLRSRDGTLRRISVSATAVRDPQGRLLMSRSVMYDISEMDRIKRELQRLNREQALMLDSDLVGIVKLRDRRVVWKNRALDRMFGFEPGELEGQPTRILYTDQHSYDTMGREAYAAMQNGGTYRAQMHMVKRSGEPIWVDVSGALLSEETGETMWLMMDITTMKRYQEQVERLAFHDMLTGLPNRTLLMDRLGQALSQAKRSGDLLAVCFIDLDGFKAVNDRFGHDAGDRLLRVIAERLRDCIRGTDTVARLGGDEFVLVLTQLANHDECRSVLDRVLTSVAEPVVLGAGQVAHVSASIGAAFHPNDGVDAEALLSFADRAMYRVKQAGRLSVPFGDPRV
jgi:diguanylate cyclase (GGDEF)-like protein/PAS domain S-box-containing protein